MVNVKYIIGGFKVTRVTQRLMTIPRRASLVTKFKMYGPLVTPLPWPHRQGGI